MRTEPPQQAEGNGINTNSALAIVTESSGPGMGKRQGAIVRDKIAESVSEVSNVHVKKNYCKDIQVEATGSQPFPSTYLSNTN